jgi:glycosyltransferase involved in cell wall biosynthesis
MAEKGHDVILAAPAGSELEARAGEAGLNVFNRATFTRGFRPRKVLADARALRALMRREAFDVVHTHGSQDSWAVAWALLGFRPRPIVLRTRHNTFPMKDHILNRKLYGDWTDGLICISEAIMEHCAARPHLRRENLTLVHDAVDATRFRTGDRSLRTELGVDDRYVAGVTGRLRPEKGHRHLLDALPKIIEVAPDFTLLVVGAGSLEGELRAQADRLALGDHAIFTGFREDVPRVLAALDLFIMPSVSEGLGTAILEAAATGLPIVASRVGGIPEILDGRERGSLVEPGDAEAIADAALAFYRDRRRAEASGRASAEFVTRHFSPQALVDKTEAVYFGWLRRRAERETPGSNRA